MTHIAGSLLVAGNDKAVKMENYTNEHFGRIISMQVNNFLCTLLYVLTT